MKYLKNKYNYEVKETIDNLDSKTTKVEKIRRPLHDLIKVSTIQGIPKIFTSKRNSFRIMWVILSLVSTVFCAFFSTKSVLEYYNYETVTSIKTINEQQSEFPTISICHYNNTDFKFEILDFWFNIRELKNEWKNHFELYNDTKYGVCYRFNSGKNMSGHSIGIKNSTSAGIEYGLYLDLYIPPLVTDYGEFKIYINNHTMIPKTIYNKGSFITSGSWHYFSIKRTFDQKLEEPYNTCLNDINNFKYDKTLIEFLINQKVKYSQKECLNLCRNMKYLKLSNFSCLNSLEDDLYLNCYKKIDEKSVIRNQTLSFIESFQQNNSFKICSDYCPLECDSASFEISHDFEPIISYSKSSNGFYYKKFQTYENISRSFLSLHIYYEDLKYTLISQSPKMQVYDLVSNIGGTLGLFLGMSFLSFVEIFEVFLESFLVYIEN